MDTALGRSDRITIAVLALGGEGGGVLADWIQDVGRANGYRVQGTSVPGVAQRTGSTVYYVEMVRAGEGGANRPDPVLAMMPVPGDVDIVIASELMETGRAILRGFVSKDRTTLIGSTHRVYAISEKSSLGDGTGANERILDAASRRAARFIGFDMAAAARESGSVISSIMFGALAASRALPFDRDTFEAAIREGGKAVEANLGGFSAGFERAVSGDPAAQDAAAPRQPTTEAGRALHQRITANLPTSAHALAIEGAARLMDWQDARYASLYLDRLESLHGVHADLVEPAARHLALWMAYDDTIRVADLKIRSVRLDGVAKEVGTKPGQLLSVTEYMHPRLQEVCETLPAGLGEAILASPTLSRWLAPLFRRGRHVTTTSLRWYLMLRGLAALRPIRRRSLRYRIEQERIERWLGLVADTARADPAAAVELLACQSLIKGYSDTFERSLRSFETVIEAAREKLIGRADAASQIAALRKAALADEEGTALGCAIKGLEPHRTVA